MKRWMLLTIAALVALIGIVFSAINADSVKLDVYFATWRVPLGVLVLAALVAGFLLAGAVLWTAVIMPLRLRLLSAQRQQAQVAAQVEAPRR